MASLLVVAAAGVVGSMGPAAGVAFVPVGTVTEFSKGITSTSSPAGISVGRGGDIWFAQVTSNQIGRITPRGKVTEFSKGITAASEPYQIAAGPDGDMWFTEYLAGRIGRITPQGKVTEFSKGITAGSGPYQITAGPDGDMWFTQLVSSQIGRITPQGKVTEFSKGITAASGPAGLAAGPDGNLWFTQGSTDQIGRITPQGKVTEFSTGITKLSRPWRIAAGPDGDMWFTQQASNEVGRITTGVSSAVGHVTEFSTGISAASEPSGITAGPDGNLWFTEYTGDRVGRITPKGKVSEFSTGITADSEPSETVVGPDGNFWFTEYTGNQVGRVTTGVPSAPPSVTASPRSNSAMVTWAAPTNPGAASVTRYRVRATPGRRGCVSRGAHSCTVHGLRNTTRYRFSVTALNAIGAGPASAPSPTVTVGSPTAVRALTATFPHPGAARVNWRAPTFHGSASISSYQVRWSTDNGRAWTAWVSTKLRRHAARTGLHKGKSYVVAVRTRNNSGVGLVATLTFTQGR